MMPIPSSVSPSRTTCASLLSELQIIWDEIGESDGERDKMLLQLEQECLDIYRRKVENSRKCRENLNQSLAECEVEINNISSALGEHTFFSRGKGSLKNQIASLKPILEDLRVRKKERINEFVDIQSQIAAICAEIAGNGQSRSNGDTMNEDSDLTANRLTELKLHLKELQSDKALRLQSVSSYLRNIHELSVVLKVDFLETVHEIHPSLGDSSAAHSKSISNGTLARCADCISLLKQQKQQRLEKLQNVAGLLVQLWNLLEIPSDEQKTFDHVTCLLSSHVDEVSKEGILSQQVLEKAEAEVERLNALKASMTRVLVFKRQNELEEIYRGVHMDVDSDSDRKILNNKIESGETDLSELLSNMDDRIAKAKELALSRKDILEKLEKWKLASEEEKWLDSYERDENRYSAGKGAHKNLKRAEKARTLVNKLPSMVESLTAKAKAWEEEKEVPFLYDKTPLLKSLEEYTVNRLERDERKRKSREQRRLQEQLAVEQELLFGSRPTPKKPLGPSSNANTMAGTPIARRGFSGLGRSDRRESHVTPLNYVALAKDYSSPSRH